jgi:exosortase A-associated hydrolase 2
MTETPFFLPSGEDELFALYHAAEEAVPGGSPWVFCHPMSEEKLWTHRVFVDFARRLAAQGHAVLRFDFMGNGDSSGDFGRSSVESAVTDVRSAIDELRRRTGADRVNLLGLRFGATIASLAAERSSDVDTLVLWSPIVDGERYMQELLRINLATQTAVYKEMRHDRVALVEMMRQGATVNVDGYEMGFPLYSEAAAIKLAAGRKRHPGPCLIVQVDRQPGRPSAELQQLAAAYDRGTLAAAQEEPFWKEIATSYLRGAPNLFAVTSDWLAAR